MDKTWYITISIPVCFGGAAFAALLAKVTSEYFQNLYDVVTNVYPKANVELLERRKVFCYNYIYFFARL